MVIVEVTRLDPGCGTIQEGQTDYHHVTKGGVGGIHNIVLAPFSCQELFDFAQLAFYLADKYRMPVFVMSGFILGHTVESVEIRTLDFGPLPPQGLGLEGKSLKRRQEERGLFPDYETQNLLSRRNSQV